MKLITISAKISRTGEVLKGYIRATDAEGQMNAWEQGIKSPAIFKDHTTMSTLYPPVQDGETAEIILGTEEVESEESEEVE